jgi:hypothetical protein
MAMRLQTLLIVGAASVGCATATYLLPAAFVDKTTPVATAEAAPAAPVQQAAAAPVASTQDPAECNGQAWPYVSAECQAAKARVRQVRVISTSRDAPRSVPLPASVQASLEASAPAPAEKPVTTASLAAPADQDSATAALLPPARPVDLTVGDSKADAGTTAQAGDIDATGSMAPAPEKQALRNDREKKARKGAEYRSRVARARDRAWMDGRYASAEVDSPAQPTVYRYPDGREVIVRPEPREMPRRRYADQGGVYANQGSDRSSETARYYPRRENSGGLLGMLFGD